MSKGVNPIGEPTCKVGGHMHLLTSEKIMCKYVYLSWETGRN